MRRIKRSLSERRLQKGGGGGGGGGSGTNGRQKLSGINKAQQAEGVKIGEIDKLSWGKTWQRMSRKGYSVSQLETIMANTSDRKQLISASLLWAAATPSEKIFKQAAQLASSNTKDGLETAFQTASNRKNFVAASLALVHYDSLAKLKKGEYYPSIDISAKGKDVIRKSSSLKRD